MKTSVHPHGELESYSIGDFKPGELVVQYSRQSAIVLPNDTNSAGSRVHLSLQPACCDSRWLGLHSVTTVNARCDERLNECCFWPSVQWLLDTTNLPEMKKQTELTAETCFSRLKSKDGVTPRTRTFCWVLPIPAGKAQHTPHPLLCHKNPMSKNSS